MTKRPVLKVNADHRPMELISWKRAVNLLLSGEAIAPHEFEFYHAIPQPHSKVYMLPTAIIMKDFKFKGKAAKPPAKKRNILFRDNFECQYCPNPVKLAYSEATLDHVVPQASGGKFSWLNIVTACKRCNTKKGCRPLSKSGMKLRKPPAVPTNEFIALQEIYLNWREEWARWVVYPVGK